MSEAPSEPVPVARPTDDPELTPAADPEGPPPVLPAEPSATNPDADGVDGDA
jgi:hypothetical protein